MVEDAAHNLSVSRVLGEWHSNQSKHTLWAFGMSLMLHILLFALLLSDIKMTTSPNQSPLQPRAIQVSIIMPAGVLVSDPEKPTHKKMEKKKVVKPAPPKKKEVVVAAKKTPTPVPKQKEQPKPSREKQQGQERATPSPLGGVQQATQMQANSTISGTGSKKTDYMDEVRAWLEKHKTYPRIARMQRLEGEVVLSIRYQRSGYVISKHVLQSSGHHMLDKAALHAVEKANPLPAMPDTIHSNELTLTLPFRFTIL